ncbi:MAG TPA: DUF4203 domain-containing protein [Vicinamibacterales bacterium]|nr:DUF4203 domain-containing protein [Vicinamibacterales bacterium]
MLPVRFAAPAALVLTVGGLISCFAGYRLFRFVLGLYGFFLGAMLTTSTMGTANMWYLVLAAVVGGVVGAVLMIAAYFIGVGLIGAGLAALALNALWRIGGGGDPPTLVLVLVCVLGALAALSVVRYVVIFGTAIAGAWTLIVGVMSLTGRASLPGAPINDVWILYPLDPMPGRWWILAIWFALALAGVVVQLSTTTKGGKRKTRPAAA